MSSEKSLPTWLFLTLPLEYAEFKINKRYLNNCHNITKKNGINMELQCIKCKQFILSHKCQPCSNCHVKICDDCYHLGKWLYIRNENYYTLTILPNIDLFESGFTNFDEIYYVCSESCCRHLFVKTNQWMSHKLHKIGHNIKNHSNINKPTMTHHT